MSSDPLNDLAAKLKPSATAKTRVAIVTGLSSDATSKEVRAQTDATGTAWLATNSDAQLSLGDRVSLLVQGTSAFVVSRLSGTLPTAVPVGALTQFAGSVAPAGWLICNGAAVSRTQFAELFTVCGTTYGAGDGATTFNLPNLTGRFPLGASGSHVRGSIGGAETVTLTAAQMPAHTHEYPRGAGSLRAQLSETGSSVANVAPGNVTSAGEGAAHENMPPFLTLSFIIRAS